MSSIKRLPEAVRSSVRSGIILFDLTRVVEELVFNSLDAGASKVSIFVGVGTNYVKVVDDGFGISRDSLVSLGERYVTSKVQPNDLDADGGSFGFRGEALASISDVALLEIVTKAQGKPNGYRKVIKGSKCLYLGIDGDRREVGTTVVVRDLFYNQPVRRKHIQASPKKVLLSVKQCVLRIALVHPNVSFSIIDIESEDELLCTKPSSSPMSLLIGGFGIEDASSFHKVNSDDGVIKLSGYISGPCDNVAAKIFQYVYINSRFVCSGPIHKLLNNLAASFECLDPSKANRSQKGKRVRSQGYPSFILNISCPPVFYDFTFEPSKTHVEFKSWERILTFVEKTIQRIWDNTVNCANRFGKDETLEEYGNIPSVIKDVDEGLSVGPEFIIKKCRTKNLQPTFDLPSPHDQIPLEEFHKNTEQFEEADCSFRSWNKEQLEEADCSFQPWEGSLAKCASSTTKNTDDHNGVSDVNFLSSDDYLGNGFPTSAGSESQAKSKSICSRLGYESLKFENDMINDEHAGFHHEFSSEWLFRKNSRKPFLHACSSRESLPFDDDLFVSKIGVESPISGFRAKRKRVGSSDEFGIMEVDLTDQSFDCFPRNLRQDEIPYCQTPPRREISGEVPSDFNFLTRNSPQRFHLHGDTYSPDDNFLSDSDMRVGNSGSGFQSLTSEWCSISPDPFKHFSSKTLEGRFRSYERDHSRRSLDIEEYQFLPSFDSKSGSIKENLAFGIENAEVLFEGLPDADLDFCRFVQEYNKDEKSSKEWPDVQVEQKTCSPSYIHSKDYTSINANESQRDQFRCRDSKQNPVPGGRLRSQSAPPFYRRKSRFISLSNCQQKAAEAAERSNLVDAHDVFSSPDAGKLKHSQASPVQSFKKHAEEDRENVNNVPETIFNAKEIKKDENCKQVRNSEALENVSVREFVSDRHQDSASSATKWRAGFSHITNNESSDVQNQDSILDISSGFHHLAADSLVPESIKKSWLDNAKVLQQVDKKFIPIVAGGALAVIDQHAADERIRLEELRQKVLSGEAKTVTYLDTEQELIMPEIGFQLLHSYAEQIKCWGWICNIHTEDSRSFKRNLSLLHQRPAVITLLAVPCILGVNLSDVDLLEFLQQLADTDGSSTMPPSINRILNSKACRGAIMFGDSLLPSECSLIVQELKQTSLCFQCAHGRPTTVPLLNLEEMHKQIAKLEAMNSSSSESWHGLRRHEFSIERASKRLSSR